MAQKELQKLISNDSISGSIGIAHTRWATHGSPTNLNSHPHLNESGTIALVHNGIIENYQPIKETLIKKGISFKSETDTEVLVHLISAIYYQEKNISLKDAVKAALQEVVGAYGIVVLCSDEPGVLIAAKM